MAQKKATPDTIGEPGSDAPSAHHRPEYPSPGCVPAEPDSVSPGTSSVLILAHSCKVHRTPEGCLENPGFLGPGAHCSGGDPQILRRSHISLLMRVNMDNCITQGKAVPPEMIRPFTESSDLLGNTAALTARLKEDGYLFSVACEQGEGIPLHFSRGRVKLVPGVFFQVL